MSMISSLPCACFMCSTWLIVFETCEARAACECDEAGESEGKERRTHNDLDDGHLGELLHALARQQTCCETSTSGTRSDTSGSRRGRGRTVRHERIDLLDALLNERLRRELDRAARVGHVVDEDGDLVLDVADEELHLALGIGPVALGPVTVDQGKVAVEAVGEGRRTAAVERQGRVSVEDERRRDEERDAPLGTAGVRRDDDSVAPVGDVVLDPPADAQSRRQRTPSLSSSGRGRTETHLTMLGSVQRLSTGTSKKPWIWLACRSIVMTWSQPAISSMLAMSFAVMGERDLSFRSCERGGATRVSSEQGGERGEGGTGRTMRA